MSSQRNIEIKNIDEMKSWAERLVKDFPVKSVLLLSGPMGVGKTQLTRFLVAALGSKETCSPSFAIHNSYQVTEGVVDHFDLYRLEDEDDLESTGFWDIFSRAKGLVIIEWADRLQADMLPPNWEVFSVELLPVDGDSGAREINFMRL